jgi:hypothetical protein
MAELGYKVDENDLQQSFDPVPADKYIAVIEDSDYVENNSGTGMILKLTWKIIDGPMENRKIFDNLSLEHVKPQVSAIARQKLNSIGVAAGVIDIKDSAQLHGIPMIIDVTVKKSEEYGMQNNIKKYLSADGKEPQRPAVNTTKEDTGLVSSKKKAWER